MAPKFSIATIARNEAKTLPKRLGPSLAQFLAADGDAVLVDTGSTDGTQEIAKGFGFRVFDVGPRFRVQIGDRAKQINRRFVAAGESDIVSPQDSIFDFSAARNFSASQAKNDFVLIADCDEAFTRLDFDSLSRRIERGVQRMDVSYVHSHDKAGNPQIAFRRAVFYDRRACSWTGVVHEVICERVSPVKSELPPESEVFLEHWQEDSANRTSYLPGLALECLENPEKDRQCHYFARELLYSKRYRSAIKEFERHIAMPNAWKPEQGQSMIYIGDCHQYLGNPKKAVACWQEAFEICPTRREALMRLAWHHYINQNHQAAAAYAGAAITIPWGGNYCDQKNHYWHEPHEILYVSLWQLGDREGSRHHWEKAISFNPTNPKYVSDRQFYVS